MRAALAALSLLLLPGRAVPAEAEQSPAQWRQQALSLALVESARVDDAYRRAETFTRAARAQIPIDDMAAVHRTLQFALSAAEQIEEPTFRGWVLSEIVAVQIAANDLIGARETTASIRSSRPRGAALAEIAQMQLRAGNVAAARETAAEIKDRETASGALRQVVAVQAARQDLTAARQTMRAIKDDAMKALAASDIAAAEVRAGELAAARAVAGEVARSRRAPVYERMAVSLVERGDVAAAMATLQDIDDPIDRALVRARISLSEHIDARRARELLGDSVDELRGAKDPDKRRSLAWSQLARMQAVSGDIAAARESLARAEVALPGIEPEARQALIRDHIARSHLRIGDRPAALEHASRIPDRVMQALLIRDIAASWPRASSVQDLFDRDPVNANPLTQTAAWFGILGAQLLQGTEGEAIARSIASSRASVLRIEEMTLRPPALAALAAASAAVGEDDAGSELAGQAMSTAAALGSAERRADAYLRIVDALDERLLFLGQPAHRPADED